MCFLCVRLDAGACRRVLVALDADVNLQDSFGATPLDQASFANRLECARVLIASNVDVNARDSAGGTALVRAVASCRLAVSLLTVERRPGRLRCHVCAGARADVYVCVCARAWRCLQHKACFRGSFDVAKLLVSKRGNASVDATDDTGCTPLMQAAFNDSADIVELLLGVDAKIDARDNDKCTSMRLLFVLASLTTPRDRSDGAAQGGVQQCDARHHVAVGVQGASTLPARYASECLD